VKGIGGLNEIDRRLVVLNMLVGIALACAGADPVEFVVLQFDIPRSGTQGPLLGLFRENGFSLV